MLSSTPPGLSRGQEGGMEEEQGKRRPMEKKREEEGTRWNRAGAHSQSCRERESSQAS